MTEYFPELNIHFLKLFGNRWAKRYERVPIELILLTMHNDIRFSKDYLEDEFIRREGFKPAKQKEAKYDIYFVVSFSKTLFSEPGTLLNPMKKKANLKVMSNVPLL